MLAFSDSGFSQQTSCFTIEMMYYDSDGLKVAGQDEVISCLMQASSGVRQLQRAIAFAS
jgi:hypothetical protein